MSSNHEAIAGQDNGQSFFETIKDQELELFGIRGLVGDLVEMCPVKGDKSRMTVDAIDRFAAKAWVLAGNELPPEYVHLMPEVDREREQEGSVRTSQKQDEAGKKQTRTSKVEQSMQDPDAESRTETPYDTPNQQEEIVQTVIAPDTSQLEAIMQEYDRQYAAQQAGIEVQRQQEKVVDESFITETTTRDSTELHTADIIQLERTVQAVQEAPVDLVPPVSSDVFVMHNETSVLEAAAQDEYVTDPQEIIATGWSEDSGTDINLSDVQADVLTQNFDTEFQTSEMLERWTDFSSEFEEFQAEALDGQIEGLFAAEYAELSDSAVRTTQELQSDIEQGVSAEDIKPPALLDVMARSVEESIERGPERAEATQKAFDEVQLLTEDLALALLDTETSEEQRELLQQQLEKHIASLMELLEKPVSETVIKRMAERLVQEKLQEIILLQVELSADKGTREHKYFKDDLLWARVKLNSESIAQYVGSFAVARSQFAIAA